MKAKRMALVVAGASLFTLGCASMPPLSGTRSGSSAAIRAAEEVGSMAVPQAQLHLQLAREHADRAKELAAHGDKERASGEWMRSESDAELALALARADQSRAEAQGATDKLRSLENNSTP